MTIPRTYEQDRFSRICRGWRSDKVDLCHTFAGYSYMDHYARLLDGRNIRLIVEIGVFQGASLRMWRELYPTATIVGIDPNPQCAASDADMYIYTGSQTDRALLTSILDQHGQPDLVIDDGSHAYSDMLATATFLLPRMDAHGLYVIEDTHVTWPLPSWPGMAKTTYGPNKQGDLTEFVQAIRDGIDRRSGPVLGIHLYYGMLAFEIADALWHPTDELG